MGLQFMYIYIYAVLSPYSINLAHFVATEQGTANNMM